MAKAQAADLAALVALARRGDLAAALEGLLALWRRAPNVELADQIARIGALVAPDRDATARQWNLLIATLDPVVLDSLLATLRADVKARRRLELLARWPTDPRLDRWVAQQYKEPPATTSRERSYWPRLEALLRRTSDRRAIELLDEARASYDANDEHHQRLAVHLDRARPHLPQVEEAALSDADRAQLAALAALGIATPSAAAVRAEALLAEVLAHPDDDALRAVLADALLEQGDPRGELITLQLDPAETPEKAKRIAQIVRSSRKHLLGPLANAVQAKVTFAKGFLARCSLALHPSSEAEVALVRSVGHPLWATVEHIEGPAGARLVQHPVMRSLRSLAQPRMGLELLAALPRLEELCAEIWDVDLLLGGAFPALRRLEVGCHPVTAIRIALSPLAARLEELRVRLNPWNGLPPDEVARVLEAVSPAPRVVLIAPRGSPDVASRFELVRVDGHLEARVSITSSAKRSQARLAADVIACLRAIGRRSPRRLVLTPGFTSSAPRLAVEALVRELGGIVE